VNTNGQLRGQQRFDLSVSREFENVSNTALRGGPSSCWPGNWEIQGSFRNDERRKLQVGVGAWTLRRDEGSRDTWSLWTELGFQPTNSLRLSLNPSYESNDDHLQYVQTSATGGEARYLFGRLGQETATLTFRIDLCLTPSLTIQYYGAPFVSAGGYGEFKRVTEPRADRYDDRFHTFTGQEIASVDGGYEVDEDGNGEVDYTITNPDFNVREFNSNLVLRWEYDLGSTLYVVWSQGRADMIDNGRFSLGDDLDALFGSHAENVFLVKFNKWFSL
jgi:hypothetical protein